MSWVYYADRRPAADDADPDNKIVIVKIGKDSGTDFRLYSTDMSMYPDAVWFDPKLLPPLPTRKIWRAPTHADLDKATEPIPCRVRDNAKDDWCQSQLRGILRFGERRFYTGCTWRFCEIEVDA